MKNIDIASCAALGRRLVGYAALWAGSAALPGCGDDSGSSGPAGGDGGSASAGGAGQPGGAGGSLPSTGGTGPLLRPPNPRPDVGPPDGVLCNVDVASPALCPVGQKCCDRAPFDRSTCEAASSTCDCPDCLLVDKVACDGPEDCPGELCCAFRDGASAGQTYGRVECAPSCQASDQIVVCKDPRDCLREGAHCEPGAVGVAVSVCD